MKKILLLIVILGTTLCLKAEESNPDFNQKLADSLGADNNGMKMYVWVILKSGTNKTADSTLRDSLFKGHMANITKLVKMGKLIVAGPLKKNDLEYRGIFIFDVRTLEEAKELVQTDPAVNAHIFDLEFYQWYGSAALPTYLQFDSKIQRMKW